MVTSIIFDWIKQGIHLNGPATTGRLRSCEEAIGFTFPADFAQFYALHNGFEEGMMDSRLVALWSLEKIRLDYDATDDFIGSGI
jgi:cell wall assembly regulator SMI1